MPTTPFPIGQFGGLNLAVDPLEVGATGAVALSNVDADIPGELRTRPGRIFYAAASDSATWSNAAYRLISDDSALMGGAKLATDGAKIVLYNGATISTTAANISGAPCADVAFFGTSGYFIDATGFNRWNGGAVTNIAGGPKGGHLATWRDQARVVAAYAGVGGVNLNRVHFSDPDAPETWTSTSWVDLKPDTESITGVVVVGETVVVFKETHAFAFQGVSTLSDGSALFNYRAINLGDRISYVATSGRFCSDGDYAYFLAARGVYRMPYGMGTPQLLSTAISPVFRGEVTAIPNNFTFVADAGGRLYVGGPTSTVTLVYDKATGQWSAYGVQASAVASIAATPRTAWMMDASAKRLTKLDPTTSTDLGNAISWSYTSGLYSPAGDPGRVAISLESQLVGSGTATLQVATTGGAMSSSGSFDTGSAVTLGTAPAIAEGWQQLDREGAWWQHKLSGTGAATVSALTHYLNFVKPSGSW